MNDVDLPVGEVWNNIYAAFFQQLNLNQGNHLYTDGWLYDYGRQPEQELQFITYLRNRTPVSARGVRPRLQFLMLMLFKVGTDAFRVFNQNYRALGNGENFLLCEHHLTDLLADAIATASGYDVTPFIQLCGLTVDAFTREQIAAHNERLIFLGYGDMPFARLAVDYEARQLVLDITNATPHSYFTNTLYASITVLTASGEKVFERKMNGTNCATGKIVVPFSNHYHLYHAEPGRLKVSPGYLTLVSSAKYQLLRLDSEELYHFSLNNDPAADLQAMFTPLADAIRASVDVPPADNSEPGEGIGKGATLQLRGQGDRTFCQLAYDNRQQRITTETLAGQPHTYYTTTYSTLTVKEESGEVIYSRHYDGITHYPADSDPVVLQAGMYIELFHDEPYRCSAINETTGQNVTLKKHNRWRVVSDGLEVDSPEQTEEKNTSDAAALYGDKFNWQLIGKEENGFASMAIDIRAKPFIFTASPIAPHSDFATEYAAVTIYNTRGTVVYRQSIKGSVQPGGYTDACGLDEDYTIEVFHAEGAERSVIRNPLNGESWPQPQHVIWQVTARGCSV